ncbi:hypothetical protein [Mucilaginibacter arboris]|uniref:Uncharacterized protein n=1 Tax=Mucilaginibacter arboris TaxID=2682090 RepID=A0A7K1SYG2_9SPHI|nr:hypothetical protein [Mucilaginibacter arboris]MVN22070.1 hypothetical protein [Mucilaginibacter arboris]
MSTKPAFTEKQYLGREFIPITIRLALSIVCFAVYFFTVERERKGDLLLIVGFGILGISILMGFILHFRIRVMNKSVLIDGLWTTQLVKIDLNSITQVEQKPYSRYFLNNPVYNLHKKGTIRFYTTGNCAIHLTDRDGLVYIIGSLHPDELERAILQEMGKRE